VVVVLLLLLLCSGAECAGQHCSSPAALQARPQEPAGQVGVGGGEWGWGWGGRGGGGWQKGWPSL